MNFGKKNLQHLTASDLKALIESQPGNIDAVLAYCHKVLLEGGPSSEAKAGGMLGRFKNKLVEEADPVVVATLVLQIPLDQGVLTPIHYLRLGGHLEAAGAIDQAGLCYRRVFDTDKTSQESEIALLRLSKLLENEYHNPDQAREAYTVFLTLFPNSQMAKEARKSLENLPPPSDDAEATAAE